MNEFLTIFYPVLYAFLVGFLAYVGKEVLKLVPEFISYVEAKIGLTNYQKIKAIAWDIWNIVEEHFRLNEIMVDTIQAKIIMFETLIKQKIPGITDAEIETVRQAIAGEFNKDKPLTIKAIEDVAAPIINVVPVAPILKYVAPDGTELQPVNTTPTV